MWFDHQSSKKALIFYWPEMKGIRCKNLLRKAFSIHRWCFVCFLFFSLALKKKKRKKRALDIIRRCVPKRKSPGFEAFHMFCWERGETLEQYVCIQSNHESLSSAPPPSSFSSLLLPQSRYKRLDNKWLEDRGENYCFNFTATGHKDNFYFFIMGLGCKRMCIYWLNLLWSGQQRLYFAL